MKFKNINISKNQTTEWKAYQPGTEGITKNNINVCMAIPQMNSYELVKY